MDTQDTQNCWEPIIHEKEGVINAFVKEALDSLEERLTRTAEGHQTSIWLSWKRKNMQKR